MPTTCCSRRSKAAICSNCVRKSPTIASLGNKAINQTRRRVLEQEQASASEKIYSIFEPHTESDQPGTAGITDLEE